MKVPSPIHILYLIGQLGLGGSEKQLYLLLKHIDRTRFQPHVVVFNPSPNYTLDEDLRRTGIVVHLVPNTYKGVLQRMFWLYRLLRQLRPHILHSWTLHDNAYAGVVGLLAGVPRRLGSVRGGLGGPDFMEQSTLIRWLILHSVHGHLVNSNAIAAELCEVGLPKQRIHILPNCVEASTVSDSKSLPEVPPNARVIGMVANLRYVKNQLMFIRALARVLPEYPQAYGVIIGQPVLSSDPGVLEGLQEEIEALGLQGRVVLAGFQTDIPKFLLNFEIFCLTSHSEGMPNAVLEAMAAGLPVAATRVGGLPDLVQDGISGLLVAPDDLEGLSKALGSLLADPPRAQRMGAVGRARVLDEFSCHHIVQNLERYYISQFTGRKNPTHA